MKQVFLAGTTSGTTWRDELTERMVKRGVRPSQIINPQLPKGTGYTAEHMATERQQKSDPDTYVLIYVCPAPLDTTLDLESARKKAERLGPISMFEIGKFAYSDLFRTVIVLDAEQFSEGSRARRVLLGIAEELREDFASNQLFTSLADAEDWLVQKLTKA